ncbi:hypothetical protein BASA81_002800 [Batrachochytrium salamandrivorans]|nr:hypothetical protein BASA81_002800 [Batrachochytrium salamandrivorans]
MRLLILVLLLLFISPSLAEDDDSSESTLSPTQRPSLSPTSSPSAQPSSSPSLSPTTQPSLFPTTQPSLSPTTLPSLSPTTLPSLAPSWLPTQSPSTAEPTTVGPTRLPTLEPTAYPTLSPAVSSTFYKPIPRLDLAVEQEFATCFNSFILLNPFHLPDCPNDFCQSLTFGYGIAYVFVTPFTGTFSFSNEGTELELTMLQLVTPDGISHCNSYADERNITKRALITVSLQEGQAIPVYIGVSQYTSSKGVLTVTSLSPIPETIAPTRKPTSAQPTRSPTTSIPTASPTYSPSMSPSTSTPTTSPTTSIPTSAPTFSPSTAPTSSPSMVPTLSPTRSPSQSPSTSMPTLSPTTSMPTTSPTTSRPTVSPTSSPSQSPTTSKPTTSPTTSKPTTSPTTSKPSTSPTKSPSKSPTTSRPTTSPTTSMPTTSPTTSKPTTSPTTSMPTHSPTTSPSKSPTTSKPTYSPTTSPSTSPTTSKPTHSPTQSPTTSLPTAAPTSSPTFQCRAGTYSTNGYDTQVEQCIKCPAGRYDQPDTRFRKDCNDLTLCQELDHWCGAGAVLGESFVPIFTHTEVDSTLVVASKSEFTVQFTKLVMEHMHVYADLVTFPKGVTWVRDVSSPATEAVFTVTFAIEADLLEGLTGDGDNLYANQLQLVGRYDSDPIGDGFTFNSLIRINIQLVSVVVNPEQYAYSLMIGSRYSSELSPLPISEVINPLCENDLVYEAQICNEGLLAFAPGAITQATITSDQGSGNKMEFMVDLEHAPMQEDWSLDARLVKTCIVFNMTLVPLGVSFVKNITVDIKILQWCPAGTMSVSGTNEFGCDQCVDRTYQSNPGSAICFPVSPGSEVNADRTAMVECPVGFMSTEQTLGCVACPLGSYSDVIGSSVCKPCPSATFPTTLYNGSISIDNCTTDARQQGFKNNKNEFQLCPLGTTCDFSGVQVETIKVNPGYYRTSNTSLDVRACVTNFCVPGYYLNTTEDGQNGTHRRRILDETYSAQDDSLYCTPHHRGHLCAICETGYVHRGEYRLCEMCEEETTLADGGRMAGLFVAFFAVVVVLSTGVVFRSYERFKPKPFIPYEDQDNEYKPKLTCTQRMGKFLGMLDTGGTTLKITIGYYQVIAGMAIPLQDYLPDYFQQLADFFSLLSLDFVKVFDFGCSMPDQSHLSSLLLATLLPLGCFICLLWLERELKKRVSYPEIIHIGFMNLYLWILFIIYPSIAKTIFQTYDCIWFDDGMAFMEVDAQIRCGGEQYRGLFAYGILSIILYVIGIPVWFYYILDKQRFQLDACPGFEPRLSLAYREKNLQVQGTSMLWAGYAPKRYNFEVFEFVRKLFQTSVFVFISQDSAAQVIFLLGICAVVIVVLGWVEPYVARSHNGLAQWSQWNIFAIAFVALLNRMELTSTSEKSALDVLLIICLISVPAGALVIELMGLSPRKIAQDVKGKLARETPQQRTKRLASTRYSSGMEYTNSGVEELLNLLAKLDAVDSNVKEHMRQMIDNLDQKYQEESEVAQLERNLLLGDRTETELLQLKIAELAEENQGLRFTTMLLYDQIHYAQDVGLDEVEVAPVPVPAPKRANRPSVFTRMSNLGGLTKTTDRV